MKILITGGAGFIGGHLAKKFITLGFEVCIIDNFKRGVKDYFLDDLVSRGVRLYSKNLLSEKDLYDLPTDYDYIFHLAAIIGVRHVLERPYEVLTTNIKMLENIITFSKKQLNLKRFIFTSTSEVYAGSLIYSDMEIPTPESTPIALTDLNQPRTSYMLSKLYGECMAIHSSLPITNVRLHNVYGPRMGMSHVIPELLYRTWNSLDGERIVVASLEHKRTFCYVSDAVEMIWELSKSSSANMRTVNIGNQSPEVSIGDLAKLILKTVRRKIGIYPIPATPGSPARRCPNTKLLHELSGIEGIISLDEGLAYTYEWYLNNVFNNSSESAK